MPAAAEAAWVGKAVSPHWLRHAHASHALARGASPMPTTKPDAILLAYLATQSDHSATVNAMATPADDLAARLARFRRKLANESDPEERADLEAAITALERQLAESASPPVADLSGSQVGDVSMGTVIGGEANVGVAVGGSVDGGVTLFTGEAHGNYIADVIHLYQQAPAAPQADYGAALRRYLSHLYTNYASLDLRGIDDRPMDMPLGEIYVSLSLHEPPPGEITGRGGLRGFFEKVRGKLTGKSEPPEEELRGGRSEPVDWTTALRHPRLAVVGAPGSGKTTLLHYTAVRLAEVLARDDAGVLAALGLGASVGSSPPVPLWLPLRELGSYVSGPECSGREAMGANSQLLLDCLSAYYQRFGLDLPPDFFSRLVSAGRALLLLDGLDEVVSREDREFVSSVVRSFAMRYPHCRYVVTARVAAYQGDAQIGAGFRICTVADLDEAQQQRFIDNWSRSLHRLLFGLRGEELERAGRRYADDLWGALGLNERVRELATNPLLLTVVAVIFYNNYVLPEDRAALYEECVEVLLRGGRGKADRAGQQRASYSGRPELKMGLDPKRELLAAVAYAMHLRGEEGLFISRGELVRTAATYLQARVPDPDETARLFVSELPVHIGLLDEREPDRFRFSHLQFQEFLAARFVAESDRWDELLDRYQDSWWREVILLCAGYLSQERCWKFLGRLVERDAGPKGRADALLLAAEALAELEKFKGQGPVNGRVQAEAAAILTREPATMTPAAARVTAGHALALVGDPRLGVRELPPPMVRFPAGRFVIGSSKAEAEAAGREYEAYYLKLGDKGTAEHARVWPEREVNDQPVSIGAFELARYQVTNLQYQLFIEDSGYDLAAPWWSDAAREWRRRDDDATEGLRDWQRRRRKDLPEFWEDPRFGKARPNHPVVGVNWYEATAFCRWLTLRYPPGDGSVYCLPSEAEWEYAARGVERRVYPWGDEELNGERANYDHIYGGTSAVGCFPAGATREGALDLAGNVWEWTRSEYRPYPYDPSDGWEDGTEPAQKSFTLRGGSWADLPIFLRAAFRLVVSPDYHIRSVGFRLARRLPSL